MPFFTGLWVSKDLISRQNRSIKKKKNWSVKPPWHEFWKLLAPSYGLLLYLILDTYRVNKKNVSILWHGISEICSIILLSFFCIGVRIVFSETVPPSENCVRNTAPDFFHNVQDLESKTINKYSRLLKMYLTDFRPKPLRSMQSNLRI